MGVADATNPPTPIPSVTTQAGVKNGPGWWPDGVSGVSARRAHSEPANAAAVARASERTAFSAKETFDDTAITRSS